MSPAVPGCSSWDTNPRLRVQGGETPPLSLHPSSPSSWSQLWGLAGPAQPLAPRCFPSRACVGWSSPGSPRGLVGVCAHGDGVLESSVRDSGLQGPFAHLPHRHRAPCRALRGADSDGFRASVGAALPRHSPQAPDWNKELQKPLSAPGSTQRPGVSAWRCLRRGGHGGLTHHPRLLLSCHPSLSSAPPWPCSPSLQWGQLGVTLRVTPEGQSWDINPEGQSRGSVPTAHPCAPPQAGLSPALPSVHEQQGGTWYPFIYKQIK